MGPQRSLGPTAQGETQRREKPSPTSSGQDQLRTRALPAFLSQVPLKKKRGWWWATEGIKGPESKAQELLDKRCSAFAYATRTRFPCSTFPRPWGHSGSTLGTMQLDCERYRGSRRRAATREKQEAEEGDAETRKHHRGQVTGTSR